jgi:diamine N-acetyltransferase
LLCAEGLSQVNLTLCAIDESNREECLALDVAPHQREFVASNSRSLAWAEANAGCVPLGVFLEKSMVGFAMFEPRGATVFSLHRIMIDASHQGRGVGEATMRLVMDTMSDLGAETIYLSFRPGNLAAKALFVKLGFVFHIEEPDGEIVYRFGPPNEPGT